MDDLGLLIKSRYPLVTIETREEERACRVVDEICLELARVPFRWSVTKGLQRSGGSQSVYDTQEPVKALKHISIASIPAVYLMLDFHPYLDEPRVVRLLREILQKADLLNLTLIFASRSIELPGELLEHAASYRLSLPGEAELARVVRETFRDLNRGGKRAYRLQESEFALLVRNLKGLTLAEAQRVVSRCVLDDDILDAKDIEAALERKKQHIEKSGLLECVDLGEEETHLGGLASLKGWLRRYSAGFSDQARKLGLRPPRGVLFVGVQGCGKSLAAKTIARQWHLPLVRLDPSQILNKYVGESEKNLRHVFEIVESVAPVVLWIDEIEKAFSNTSGSDGDGGLGRRIFGSFLTWMQEKKDGVFVSQSLF